MNFLFEKLHLDRYLNAKIIFAFDLFLSCFASLCAILLLQLIFPAVISSAKFIIFWVGLAALSSGITSALLRTYFVAIRHSTIKDMGRIGLADILKEALMLLVVIGLSYCLRSDVLDSHIQHMVMLAVIDFAFTFFFRVFTRSLMLIVYDALKVKLSNSRTSRMNVCVYGTGNKSVSMIERFKTSPHYNIVGLISRDNNLKRQNIAGVPVFMCTGLKDFERLRGKLIFDAVLFSTRDELLGADQKVLKYCSENAIKVLIAPAVDEVVDGRTMRNSVREIRIEDLLGRDEIKISLDEIKARLCGKTVMVTGAAGSIGSELCRQLAGFGVKELVLFDNAETPMHNLRLELEERFPDLSFVPVIGDVRLTPRLDFAFRKFRPQVVFHAAAYKHVPLMEENPCEAVFVNVVGSRNVADKCVEYDVEKMVMVSTDKAVNPTNIMGCTKRLAEIYVQSLGCAIAAGRHPGKTKFVTTRFGNVLGSNGSVIPRFREQIEKGGPVTVTHPDIVRFFMTIPEACRLVMEAAMMSSGNEIFVFDMGESIRIADLATKMIELAGYEPGKDIKIEYTGLRPGEKLFEEVLSNEENTLPTSHERIRIAKVREYEYGEACATADRLEVLARAVDIPEMVLLMKRTVSEFKSQNSVYEKMDAMIEAEQLANDFI